MNFVNPTYLWAFLGLLVPITIHLWSNKEGRIVKIGSVKFLENSESSQSKSIKLNEYLLLFLRLLLLSLLVLILAEPQLNQKHKNKSLTYIVEPSLLKNNTVKTIIYDLDSDKEVRVFIDNFPEVKDYKKNISITANYWQLAQQLGNLNTDSIVVFTKGFVSGIKGKRPTVNKPIKWIVFGDDSSVKEEPILAFKEGQNVNLISVNSSASHLSFNNQKIDSNSSKIVINTSQDSLTINDKTIPLKLRKRTSVLIYYDEQFENQIYYIEASLKAIEKYTNNEIKLEKSKSINGLEFDNYSLVIWLSEKGTSKIKTNVLQYFSDDLASNIIEKSKVKSVFHLTKKLSTKTMLDGGFVNQLFKLLYHFEIDEEILNKVDKRVISESELQTDFSKTASKILISSKENVTKWLWFPFLFILALERIIAMVRKQ